VVGYGKSGVLENKNGDISETRKDRGKVTMDCLYELTNALSNGTIPDPLWPPLVCIARDRPNFWVPLLTQEQDF